MDFIQKAGLTINGKSRKVVAGKRVIQDRFFSEHYDPADELNINYGKTTKAWKIPNQSLAYISVNGPGDGRDGMDEDGPGSDHLRRNQHWK